MLLAATAVLSGLATSAQAAPGGTPKGNLEKVTATAAGVQVKAWALDPNTRKPVSVQVSVDGKAQRVLADAKRPDVGRAFPGFGSSHGVATTIAAAPGSHRVCLTVVNVGAGVNNDLGCRVVTVPGATAAPAAATRPATATSTAPSAAAATRTATSAATATAGGVVRQTATASRSSARSGVRPDESNTGVPAGVRLTRHSGDLVITKAGTVVDGLDVYGTVSVRADDVTIKNTRVRGKVATHNTPLISMNKGFRNLVVMDTEIAPDHRSPYQYGIMGWNFTLERVNIHHVIDSAHIYGPNVTIRNSYLHDNTHYVNDPNWGGKPSHDDGIQIQQGHNIRIIGNRIEDAYNVTVMVTQDQGRSSDIHLIGNWLDGSSCNINLAEKGRGPITGVVAKDNTFGRDTRHQNCAMIAPSTSKIAATGNTYTDGATATVRAGR